MTVVNDVVSRGGTGDRLAAANRARWETKTERMVSDVVSRLSEMPKPMLAALAIVVVEEVERR